MIELLVALWAFFGFGIGDAEDPRHVDIQLDNQQIIKAIDSNELKGFNVLEAHDAKEWFV